MSNNRYGGVDSYAAFFIAYKARTLIRMAARWCSAVRRRLAKVILLSRC